MTPKEEFIEIYNNNIKREGADKLLAWMSKADFFEAPASTRFHLAEESGLVIHSIHVYNRLIQLCTMEYGEDIVKEKMMESITICSLLHDLCKVNFYSTSFRNAKNDETGKWEKVPFYQVSEKLKYGGHGSKSVFLIERFMRLEIDEAIAINCHMASWDTSPGDYSIGSAFGNCKLALLTHMADELASFIDEVE